MVGRDTLTRMWRFLVSQSFVLRLKMRTCMELTRQLVSAVVLCPNVTCMYLRHCIYFYWVFYDQNGVLSCIRLMVSKNGEELKIK